MSLRLTDMVRLARIAIKDKVEDISTLRESGGTYASGKTSSSIRGFREIKNRLEELTIEQKNVLANSDLVAQKQVAFLSICKNYSFIKDFAVDILREKALVFNYQIHESDYKTFIDSRLILHPELEQFSETTMKKAKQVMFRIFEQSGVINNAVERVIQPQILQSEVVKAIINDDPEWLKIFLIPDRDIEQLIQLYGHYSKKV